jgi:hypothetical protein
MKGGGEVFAMLRSNPKLMADPDSGEALTDEEILSEHSFEREMKEMDALAFDVGQHYLQLIARLPLEFTANEQPIVARPRCD